MLASSLKAFVLEHPPRGVGIFSLNSFPFRPFQYLQLIVFEWEALSCSCSLNVLCSLTFSLFASPFPLPLSLSISFLSLSLSHTQTGVVFLPNSYSRNTPEATYFFFWALQEVMFQDASFLLLSASLFQFGVSVFFVSTFDLLQGLSSRNLQKAETQGRKKVKSVWVCHSRHFDIS